MIAIDDRQRLLDLARRALVARVQRHQPPLVPPGFDLSASGAFVTAYCQGELRGCLGALELSQPLAEAIVRLAGDVAVNDYRFNPLQLYELEAVTLDISVLTPPQIVADWTEIVIGRDGVIIERGSLKGLLLPQVAIEHQWDRETFLAHACLKAGLPREAWLHGARILTFSAEVFGDTRLSS